MLDKQSTGACGEFYVAGLLAGHGLAVSVPRGGAARDDLFIADTTHGRPIRLQVKTARDPFGPWKGRDICSWDCKLIEDHSEVRWYAFVGLRGWPEQAELPHVYFVPSKEVAERMKGEVGKSRTFFWMYCEEAEPFLNHKGIEHLIAALK